MLLGKRARPTFKRTTSTTGMTVDLSEVEVREADDRHQPDYELHPTAGTEEPPAVTQMLMTNFSLSQSPRNLRALSGNYLVETSQFLRTCGFCHRRLSSARDIYMYRGDTGFCSLDCREKQIIEDEKYEQPAPATATPESRAPRKSRAVAYA